jgi:PAS domain S-box-containing protein
MNKDYFNQIFEALPSPSMIVVADSPRFAIVEVNNAYLAATGLKKEELIGKGFFEAFPDMPKPRSVIWSSLLNEVLQNGKPNQTPVSAYNTGSNGHDEAKYFTVTNTPVFDEKNEIAFIVRTVTNIHDDSRHENTFVNEKFLYETQRIARVGGWEADLISGLVVWSDVVKDIYGSRVRQSLSRAFAPGFTARSRIYTTAKWWNRN